MTFPQTDPTQPFPAPPVEPAAVKPRKMVRRRTALWVGAGVFFVGVAIGSAGGKQPAPQPAPQPVAQAEPAPAVTVTVTETKTLEPVAPATPPPPPAPVAPMIASGTWTVGTDFPAGTYRTEGADSNCFWSIYKSGSNQADIIQNHIGGGNLTVTLRQGQDFTSERCGVWKKQG